MSSSPRPVDAALATLRQRWGQAAPRTGREAFGAVVGALATVPLPDEPLPDEPLPDELLPDAPGVRGPAPLRSLPSAPHPRPTVLAPAEVVSTGFAELDAILGTGGIPRTSGLALAGDLSSGRTTLALRLVAEAQAAGSIVAYVDLDRAFDPIEAVARGVRLEWLVVAAPASIEEGLAMAGALLQGRSVDLLLLDLPARLQRSSRLTDRLARLAAFARRSGALLVVLEPPGHRPDGWLGPTVGLRLALRRRAWVRLGRDVVGQRTEVEVARSRFGPPGRRAEVLILYAEGGPRDRCLRRSPLLDEGPPAAPRPPRPRSIPQGTVIDRSDATPPSLLAPPPAPARRDADRHAAEPPSPGRPGRGPGPVRVYASAGADGSGRPRRSTVVRRLRPGRRSSGARAGRPTGHAARSGPPPRS
jgi:hypothetical protein